MTATLTDQIEKENIAAQTLPGTWRQKDALDAMAERYHATRAGIANVIRQTCIKGNCSDAEFMAFIIVANQYGLNPMTKEIHAFASGGAIVPIVGIDGWCKIVNAQNNFDGCEFKTVEGQSPEDIGIECTMHVKGRAHPIRVTEWLKEVKKNTAPWNTLPRRMLRHRAFIQSARLAFGLGGIFDEDEARDIVTNIEPSQPRPKGVAAVKERLAHSKADLLSADLSGADLSDAEPHVIASAAVTPFVAAEVATTLDTSDSQTSPSDDGHFNDDLEPPKGDTGADTFPPGCTLAQVKAHAINHAPTSFNKPEDAGDYLLSILRTDYSTPWTKWGDLAKSKVWEAITAGTFFKKK